MTRQEWVEKIQKENGLYKEGDTFKAFGLNYQKVCINSSRAVDYKNIDGKLVEVPMLYRRNDFTEWAEEAFNKGKKCFYHEPINPDDPCGPHRKVDKPQCVYRITGDLTEEQFEYLVNILEKQKEEG